MKRWLQSCCSGSQSGDTLVEVVLAIAILTSVLATAYNISTVAFGLGVQSRERTQAINLVQQQAEELRYYASAQMAAGTTLQSAIASKCAVACSMTSGTALSTAVMSCGSVIAGNCTISFTTPDSIAPGYDEIDAQIAVSWTSLIGGQRDSSTLDVRIADTTGFNPLDCSVAGTPGCSVDTRASGPSPPSSPPPPPPVPFSWVATGASYKDSNCIIPETPLGDGFDGCFRTGSSLFAWRVVDVTYDSTDGILTGTAPVGPAHLVFNYNQYDARNATPPDGYPGYELNIKITAGSLSSTTSVTLPIPSDSSSYNPRSSVAIPVTIPAAGPFSVEYDWTNNPGYDPNLQVNTIQLEP